MICASRRWRPAARRRPLRPKRKAAALLLPALLSLTGASWLDAVSWAASLGGWDLMVRRKALVWLAVWIVTGVAALWASRREWRRYRA